MKRWSGSDSFPHLTPPDSSPSFSFFLGFYKLTLVLSLPLLSLNSHLYIHQFPYYFFVGFWAVMAYQPIRGSGSGLQFLNNPFGDTTYTKVFVGGLAWETKSETLHTYFNKFGEILEAVVISDKHTGRSKGYGFVSCTIYILFSIGFFYFFILVYEDCVMCMPDEIVIILDLLYSFRLGKGENFRVIVCTY